MTSWDGDRLYAFMRVRLTGKVTVSKLFKRKDRRRERMALFVCLGRPVDISTIKASATRINSLIGR